MPFENDWRRNVEIINNHFKECSDFCFVHEIRVEDKIPPHEIQVILAQSGGNEGRYTMEEQTQIVRDAGKNFIGQFPLCKFSLYYLCNNTKIIILEYQPIQEQRKSHQFYKRPTEMYYRGLPKVFFVHEIGRIRNTQTTENEISPQYYSITLTQLCKLMKRPQEYILDVLNKKGLSVAKLSFTDMIDLILDHRIVKQRTDDGKFKDVLLYDAREGWMKAQRLLDQIVFNELYEKIKQNNNYKCQCCSEKGSVIHHIDGDHGNMTEKNLAFLCDKCHYELHKDGLEEIKKMDDYLRSYFKNHHE
ncbi:MAG: HNH endonuclease signature motif containing protein [Nitrospirota bacterium]